MTSPAPGSANANTSPGSANANASPGSANANASPGSANTSPGSANANASPGSANNNTRPGPDLDKESPQPGVGTSSESPQPGADTSSECPQTGAGTSNECPQSGVGTSNESPQTGATNSNTATGDKPQYVYILRCADGSLYTGWTTNLAARVATHNAGKGAKYTRSRRPVELVYFETYTDKGQALSREGAIKKLTRGQKLALIASRSANNSHKWQCQKEQP